MNYLDIFLKHYFANPQKAAEIKEDLKKRVFYQEKIINMSDRCLSKEDRFELYDFFCKNDIRLHKLKTRVESLEELEQFRRKPLYRSFQDVEVKYPWSFVTYGQKMTKIKYFCLNCFDKIYLIGRHVALFYNAFEYMRPQNVILFFGALVFPKLSAFFLSCVTYEAYYGDEKALEILKYAISTFVFEIYCALEYYSMSFVHNVCSDLKNQVSDASLKLNQFLREIDLNYACVFNGKVTKNESEKSEKLTNVISEFYEALTSANNLHYAQMIGNFGQKIKELKLADFNSSAVNLMVGQKKQGFNGLVDIFNHEFIAFYEMTRPRNLMQFEKLLQENKGFAKAVRGICDMNHSVNALLKFKMKNVSSLISKANGSFDELLEKNVAIGNLAGKKGALTEVEMKNLVAKGLMFDGVDWQEFRENLPEPVLSTEDKWVKFIHQNSPQLQREPTI